ncbi:cytochrome P450 9e2-like [Arctopsyche grandis]|uniref:cytochrome P450 9e2-like n=1 Tax=Arctopsyche grandis TaxID=121162 RepID=UPI00406D8F6B
MSFNWWDALLLLTSFIVIFFAYGYWESGYFKRKGIKNVPFSFPLVGNLLNHSLAKEHFVESVLRVYRAFPKEKYVGFMQFNNGLIMIRDLETIKQIGIKDFESFPSHMMAIDESFDPIVGKTLIFIAGDEWKDMRATLSPTFTSFKLKNMISLVDQTAKQLIDFYFDKLNEPENKVRGFVEVEIAENLSKYTNDVAASTIFGMSINSLTEKHNEFFTMGLKLFEIKGLQLLKLVIYFGFPALIRITGVQYLQKQLKSFFRNLVLGSIKLREENKIVRHDMIQLLMEAWKGKLAYDDSQNEGHDAGFATVKESTIGKQIIQREWTEDDIVAQAVLYFLAGYETPRTTLSFAIHELTVNPEIQNKLQIEIDEFIAEKGDTLEYLDLMSMEYMDMVVCETLRKWSPVHATDRKCLKPCKLPPANDSTDEGYTVQAGEGIFIPIHAIHHDPQYFPDPEKFDPERFSNENKKNINPLAYLPFGIGPRNCVGSRYGLMIVKTIIFRLLSKFDLVMTAKTQNPVIIDNKLLTIQAKDGIWIGLQPRNNC